MRKPGSSVLPGHFGSGRCPIETALHYAVQQISRFPEVRRTDRDCEDMRAILSGCFPEMVAEFRANDRRWDDIYKPKAVDAGFRPLGAVGDED